MLIRVRKYAAFFTIAIVGACAYFFVAQEPLSVKAQKAYEYLHVQVDRSAQTPYEYGNHRFSALEAQWYDIDAAEYYFRLAHARDPKLPYVNHQIARIEFLRGDFSDAFIYINRELEVNPNPSPSTYYIRGLIAGFAGLYDVAAQDYEKYLESDPTNWAALNDYAWVLLKANRPDDALVATTFGLRYFPYNPWLLNSNAIALFETGHLVPALEQVRKASESAMYLEEIDWLIAYPGNDPRIAREGLQALFDSIRENMQRIRVAVDEEREAQ